MSISLQQPVVEFIDSEDWCFICKDGGQLILCDYRGCTKVYHKGCLETIECSDMDQDWNCGKHFCFLCKKDPWYHCYTCPTSLCTPCSESAYFFPIRGQKGLCEVCAGLVSILESSETPSFDGVALDLHDRETYECLFSEYWNVIKAQECITKEEVRAVSRSNSTAKKQKEDKENNGMLSSCSSDEKLPVKKIKRKVPNKIRFDNASDDELLMIKIKGKASKKPHFDGWCSKPLKNFLASIGKDTNEILSINDAESIIFKYVEKNKLWNKKNKKKINCDEELHLLLSRKSVRSSSIRQQLETHISVHFFDVSEKESNLSNKKHNNESFPIPDAAEEVKHEESTFASVITENLKLIFLKRSVVEELLKVPEEFVSKVSGCFVRVKNHPLDFMKKTSHQLVLVKGIVQSENTGGEVHLLVCGLPSEAALSSLSNSDFSEEEVEDLRDRIEKKLHPKLIYKEVKEKAKWVHEDITKQWIKEEMERVQNLINLSNEKGWRAEYPFNGCLFVTVVGSP